VKNRAATGETQDQGNDVSIRRLLDFGFLQVNEVGGELPEGAPDLKETVVTAPSQSNNGRDLAFPPVKLFVRRSKEPTLKDIDNATSCKSDTTGLIEVWPAEQALAWVAAHIQCSRSEHMKVMELGAGYGLAGLTMALAHPSVSVDMTDGNEECIHLLRKNIVANGLHLREQGLCRAFVLNWRDKVFSGPDGPLSNQYDLVICSDCFYFEALHDDLVRLVGCCLKVGGQAILVAPQRGGSLDRFLAKLAQASLFDVERSSRDWDNRIQSCIDSVASDPHRSHLFDPKLHQLIKVLVTRKR
jgi:calmodulin-lysine N-methyltransferase